ncbi:hypothetical protein J2X73_000595 [Novosphingobium sp. 1748]|nr:hypothetical protein [Novosphingobium sp. 1748]
MKAGLAVLMAGLLIAAPALAQPIAGGWTAR